MPHGARDAAARASSTPRASVPHADSRSRRARASDPWPGEDQRRPTRLAHGRVFVGWRRRRRRLTHDVTPEHGPRARGGSAPPTGTRRAQTSDPSPSCVRRRPVKPWAASVQWSCVGVGVRMMSQPSSLHGRARASQVTPCGAATTVTSTVTAATTSTSCTRRVQRGVFARRPSSCSSLAHPIARALVLPCARVFVVIVVGCDRRV